MYYPPAVLSQVDASQTEKQIQRVDGPATSTQTTNATRFMSTNMKERRQGVVAGIKKEMRCVHVWRLTAPTCLSVSI